MGGSQSTRKISVDNDNSIQVSQEALERIQAQLAAKVMIILNYIIYINVSQIKQTVPVICLPNL